AARRWGARQGVHDGEAVLPGKHVELLAVDDLLVRARAVEKPSRVRDACGRTVPKHRHERYHARTTRDRQQRAFHRPVPDEVPADRAAYLEAVADRDRVVEERRYLAVGYALDGEVDLSGALWLRRHGVAPLSGVPVLRGEPNVVVLPGSVRRPVRQGERERLHLGCLDPDCLDGRDLPLERTFHLSRLYTALLSTGRRGCCSRATPRTRAHRAPSPEGHAPISRSSKSTDAGRRDAQVRH